MSQARRVFRPRPMLEALEAEGVRYVIIGGTAAAIGGASHVTFDLDITPARDEANLERVAAALRPSTRALGAPARSVPPFRLTHACWRTAATWNLTTRLGDLDLAFAPAGTRGYGDLRRMRPPSTSRPA